MTQKGNLFKGQNKKKTIPPSRHGKAAHVRKGKRVIKSAKSSKDMEVDRELTKFINQCNETKAATVACKDGVEFSILKTIKSDTAGSSKK